MKPDPEVSSRAWRNIRGSSCFVCVNYLVQNVVYKLPLSEGINFLLGLGTEVATYARMNGSLIISSVRRVVTESSQ